MYIIYTSSQKTRHQKLNSYWVMNSLGDKICPPAAPSTPVNECSKHNSKDTYLHRAVAHRENKTAQ